MKSASPDQDPRNREVPWYRTLSTRVFAVVAITSLAAVIGAVMLTRQAGNRIGRDAAVQALERSISAQAALQRQRLDQLALISEVFVSDADVAAYFSASLERDDPASMFDLLEERRDDLGFDFAVALDSEGGILVRTDQAHQPGASLADSRLVQRAIQDYGSTGVWLEDGRLYNVAVVPIAHRRILEGYLMVGFVLDQAAAAEIRETSEADIAYGVRENGSFRVVASTLPRATTDEMVLVVDQLLASEETHQLELEGRRWLVRAVAVDAELEVWSVALTSLEARLEPFWRLGRLLTFGGLASLLITSGLIYFLVNRSLRPLSRLALAASDAARGNYEVLDLEVGHQRSDEVGVLFRAFRGLLLELQERRDMEIYLANLAKSLPDSLGPLGADSPGKDAPGPPPEPRVAALRTDVATLAKSAPSVPPLDLKVPVPEGTAQRLEEASSALQMLGSRFKILGVLGRGGMGVVYKAHDLDLGEAVALKMVSSSLHKPEWFDRLKEELRLARRVTHPNVLRTYDFGEIDGLAFISMEYVRGITLRELLSSGSRIPYAAGLRILRDLLRGLQAAHDEGVIHRDIKPENLLIALNGTTKLMDFGIAQPRRQGHATSRPSGVIEGTPAYMAPEVLLGEEPTESCDLYAVGLVAYEIFTGVRPFPIDSAHPKSSLFQRTKEEAPLASCHWKEIPPVLERILERALARNATDRYAHAAEMLNELRGLRTEMARSPLSDIQSPAKRQRRSSV